MTDSIPASQLDTNPTVAIIADAMRSAFNMRALGLRVLILRLDTITLSSTIFIPPLPAQPFAQHPVQPHVVQDLQNQIHNGSAPLNDGTSLVDLATAIAIWMYLCAHAGIISTTEGPPLVAQALALVMNEAADTLTA